jgi:hypothetical protein
MQIKAKERGGRERFVAAASPFDLHQGSKSIRRSASA